MPTTVLGWVVGMAPLMMVSFVIYAILRGHLVPKTTVDDIRKDRDSRLAEYGQVIDIWRNAALLKDEAFKEMSPVLEQLVENDETVLKLLRAIKQVAETPPVGGTHE
jgi:hypothetical protein